MDSQKSARITLEQETNNRLTLAHEVATPEDREQVNILIRRAVGATPSMDVMTFTPGMAALLFHDHNNQNRKWVYATTLDYERQMRSGDWEFTNNAIGFNATGPVIDGQHRLAAVALSGSVDGVCRCLRAGSQNRRSHRYGPTPGSCVGHPHPYAQGHARGEPQGRYRAQSRYLHR